MKRLILTIVLLSPACLLFAQQEKSDINKGNKLYEQQKYKEAEEAYRKSVAKKTETVEGNFNLGDALYKQKQYDKAQEQFNKLGASSNKAVASQAYHNLGNSMLESKKLEESIEAYKKALINNPADDQTRYNLAYAQEKLKKQNQDKKNNKDNKNNKDDKNKKDQNKQNQDKKDQDKKDQDKKNQDQNKNDQNKDQDKKDQQNGQQPNKISKEDAQRMLDALNNQEKDTQDKLKNKKLKGVKVHITKDW